MRNRRYSLEKLLEKLIEKGKKSGNEDFFVDNPSHGIVNTTLLEQVCKYMDAAGVPYIRYGIKNKSKDLILFEKKNMDLVKRIEKGTRIRMGLQIETEMDLHIALFEQNRINSLNERIVSINELTEYEAKRIEQLMSKAGFACAYKQIRDNTYRISAHEKRKRKLLELLLVAIFEEIYEPKEVVAARLKIYREPEKIANLLDVFKAGKLEETYLIYSLLDSDKSIEVSRSGLKLSDSIGDRLFVPAKEKDIDEIAKILLTEIEYPACESAEDIEYKYKSKENFLDSYPSVDVLDISNQNVQAAKEHYIFKTEMRKGEIELNTDNSLNPVSKEVQEYIKSRCEQIGYEVNNPQVPFDFITGKAVGYDMELVMDIVKEKYIDNGEQLLGIPEDKASSTTRSVPVIRKGEEDEI